LSSIIYCYFYFNTYIFNVYFLRNTWLGFGRNIYIQHYRRYPLTYPIVGVWFIFLLIRVFRRVKIEVTEEGLTKKRWGKIIWTLKWEEIAKMEYSKMSWHYCLSPNVVDGDLLVLHNKKEIRPFIHVTRKGYVVQHINLFYKDIQKIMNEFGKDKSPNQF